MLPLIGSLINKQKLVSCYLKKKGIDFSERGMYDNMSDEELKEMITSEFDVKGDVNWKSLQKAKKIDSPETEHDIQVKVCKYLKEHKIGHWAVPNGFVHNGDKVATARYINYMKSEGVKNGVFDITICYGNGKVAFLEIKTKKGRPSEHQLLWLEWFENNGYIAKICYGYDECIEFIEQLKESEVNE